MKDTTAAPLADVQMTVGVRSIIAQLNTAVCDTKNAVSLPLECYTSEEWFDFELRAIWDRGWVCLGHQGTIPRHGDYFSIDINGDPYLVVRGKDGDVRVLSAVCQHRGHLLAQDSGNTRRFVCPYHAWSYDLDGKLVSAPGMDAYASVEELRSGHCLPRLRVEIWNGFVFINLDNNAPPLAPRLKRLSAELENYHLGELAPAPFEDYPNYPWNWKWMHENGLEPYHVTFAHKGYHEMAPAHQSRFPDWDEEDDGAICVEIKTAHIDASFNKTAKCLFPVIRTLPERDRWLVRVSVVPPNLLLATLADLAFYFIVRPHGANSLSLRIGFLFPKTTLELPEFDNTYAKVMEGFSDINIQDIRANTSIQQGRRSRFGNRGRVAPLEMPIAHLNRWLVKRYYAYANEMERKAGPAS